MTPARMVAAGRHEGEAWRGDDAQLHRIGADGWQAGRERGDEHVAGAPGVLPDHHAAATAVEQVGDRAAEVVGQGRGQVDVGDAPDPVGAEQPPHQGAGVAAGWMTTVTLVGEMEISVTPFGSETVGVQIVLAGAQARRVEHGGQVTRIEARQQVRATAQRQRQLGLLRQAGGAAGSVAAIDAHHERTAGN